MACTWTTQFILNSLRSVKKNVNPAVKRSTMKPANTMSLTDESNFIMTQWKANTIVN